MSARISMGMSAGLSRISGYGARVSVVLLLCMVSACGYHLVGQGDQPGAIPVDVETLSLAGNADARLQSMLKQRLSSDRYQWVAANEVVDSAHHALIEAQVAPLVFQSSAYDGSGIANQYRMVFSGSLRLEQAGKTVWQSGSIARQGDLYLSSGPAGIEAERTKLLQDLEAQWVSDVIARLRSGF